MRASDLVYERLRQEIIGWTLMPGASLGEIETATRLGVSRTPLREALARLAAEGLIETSGRTARVAPLSREHVKDLFELREALETQAARLAARRRDPERFRKLVEQFRKAPRGAVSPDPRRPHLLASELDSAIEAAAANRILTDALDDIRGQVSRASYFGKINKARLDQATLEHAVIAEAIFDGDELMAMQATAIHLRNSLANIVGSLPED